MTETLALVTVASCDFCPAILTHVSSDKPAHEYFIRHRWTRAERDNATTLNACTNAACRNELKKILNTKDGS